MARQARQGSAVAQLLAVLVAARAPLSLPFVCLSLPLPSPSPSLHPLHQNQLLQPITLQIPSIALKLTRASATTFLNQSCHAPSPNTATSALSYSLHSFSASSTLTATSLFTNTTKMSESRLDQSLESIISSRKQSARKGRGGRRSDTSRPAATAAPIGGVKKSTKQPKQPKGTHTGPIAPTGGESKIMISNLVYCPLSVMRQTPLTQNSRWMSSRTNFRYVRPLQVFEPILVALCARTRPSDEIGLSSEPSAWLLSHVLQRSHVKICVWQTHLA